VDNLQYRPAVAADAVECVALRGRTRENAISAAVLASMGITAASRGKSIETGRLLGYLCTDDKTIVGYCFGDKDTGEIVVLAVLPHDEGRGIGKALLLRVVKDLRSLGYKRLFLGCSRASSHRSFGFYRHIGISGGPPRARSMLTTTKYWSFGDWTWPLSCNHQFERSSSRTSAWHLCAIVVICRRAIRELLQASLCFRLQAPIYGTYQESL
jgi:ribosomal protein S18 acetylase RimI-like enzyme